jgi:hypothetical protein
MQKLKHFSQDNLAATAMKPTARRTHYTIYFELEEIMHPNEPGQVVEFSNGHEYIQFDNGDSAYLIYRRLSSQSRYFITGTYYAAAAAAASRPDVNGGPFLYCIELEENDSGLAVAPPVMRLIRPEDTKYDVWRMTAGLNLTPELEFVL